MTFNKRISLSTDAVTSMAKRRSKKKFKRNVVGFRRNVTINAGKQGGSERIINNEKNKAGLQKTVDDLKLKVQFTETNEDTSINSDMNNLESEQQSNRVLVKLKGNTSKEFKPVNKQHINNDENKDEVWVYPTETDGEKCIDIHCGANDALMYLDRLCVGSQGACIKFVDSWLTPNEFQMVSGRETAKDWKRSIRHKGRSLKLLINKGLINLRSIPKKTSSKSAKTSPLKSDNTNPETKHNEGYFTENPEGVENICLSSEKGGTDNVLQPGTQIHDVIQKRGRKPKAIRGRRFTNRNGHKKSTDEPKEIVTTRKTPDVNIDFSDEVVRAEAVTDRTSNITANSEKLDESDNTAATDTRTEEDRRLDEFMKSLRLTKTNGGTTSLVKLPNELHTPVSPAPLVPSPNAVERTATTCTPEIEKHIASVDEVDPDMPILQKEADVINAYDAAALTLSVSVNAMNATVTPPPTPPSVRHEFEHMTKSVDYLNHIETFKSTLASPSNGLKLTINRETVNCQQYYTDSDTELDTKSVYKPENKSLEHKPEAAAKALLLQDALKSARNYKERLQQSQLKSPTASTVFVSKATVESLLPNMPTNREQYDKEDTKSTRNRYNAYARKGEAHRTGTNSDVSRKRRIGAMTPSVQLPSVEDTQRHSTKSLKVMAATGSDSGSLPLNTDKNDAADSSLRDLQLQYDMLRMLRTQGQLCMTSSRPSSLLSPMVTQQLLLGMTQQLQIMCNVPDIPVPLLNGASSGGNHKQNNTPPLSRTSCVSNSKQNSLSSHFNIDENHKKSSPMYAPRVPKAYNNDIGQLRNVHSMQDIHTNKRKFIESDNGGAIDLSMKKPRTVVNSYNHACVQNIDGPLDFSLKRSYSSNSSTATSSSCTLYSSQSLYSSSTNKTFSHPYTHSNVITNHTPVTSISTTYRNHTDLGMSTIAQCTCSSGFSEMTSWSVEQVCSFLTSVQGCAPYTKTFREQHISGRLLPYLTSQHLTQTLGMASFHASLLINAVERRLRDQKSFNCPTCMAQKTLFAVPTHS